MITKIWVETPFGDFDYVPTDFSKGSTCSQCAARDLGHCCDLPCEDVDNETMHYHFERRFK